ncbi:non-ribosomal peptide synthetase [Streptomyces sp. NPDC055243]|uniref:non-ribosomal peptide synthetase n=1 Tax=Streptomyces sp. NPDC055243 TaxID=3365720 RepID=UPI0037CF9D27
MTVTVDQEASQDDEFPPSVYEWFAGQAQRRPDCTAVVQGDVRMTFGELHAGVVRLSEELLGHGVGPEQTVGLFADRSPGLVIGLLAILRAGGAYVPLGTDLPTERLAFMVRDTAMKLAVTDTGHERLPTGEEVRTVPLRPTSATPPKHAPARPDAPDPARLAYVLYTSGSTGRPKGVAVEHSGLSNYVGWTVSEFSGGAPVDTYLHTPLGFDFSLTSFFLPLVTGGTLHLAPREQEAEDLATAVQNPDIDLVRLTPSHIEMLTARLGDRHGLRGPRRFVVGGEILRARHLAALRRLFPDSVVYNHYGPTETVVGRCFLRLDATAGFHAGEYAPDDPLPIGHPLPRTRVTVDHVDERRAADGVGELVISGAGVARGYLNLPDATDKAFGVLPDGAGRFYRTGDLVRLDSRGRPVVVGRADGQVKIRGHRVEVAEIEARLCAVEGVRAAVVLKAREPRSVLGAFVVLDASGPSGPDFGRLRSELAASLPPYMIPQHFSALAELPLTRHGKLDRGLLQDLFEKQAPASADRAAGESEAGQRDGLMREVCALCERVLGVRGVRPGDNFVDLGGDSITAMKLATACRRKGITVRSVRFLTADSLADALRGAEVSGAR